MQKQRVLSRQQAHSTSNSTPILARAKYRSKLEERLAKQLTESGIEFSYETLKISYEIPARKAKYTPDFIIGELNGTKPPLVIEAKGRFRTAQDRQKLLLVKEQYPDLDLRLVFQNAKTPIYPGSPTPCSKWAEDNGFLWADHGKIPEEWLQQKTSLSQNS